jgi:hypothetical protein
MNFHQLESGSNEIEYCITVYTISYSSTADDGLEVISAGQSRIVWLFSQDPKQRLMNGYIFHLEFCFLFFFNLGCYVVLWRCFAKIKVFDFTFTSTRDRNGRKNIQLGLNPTETPNYITEFWKGIGFSTTNSIEIEIKKDKHARFRRRS